MKRNRKAEAKKKERVLSRQEGETRRVAVLLTEMEGASGQVLRNEFGWDQEKVDQFLEAVRERFKAKSGDLERARGKQRLTLTAQLFGLTGVEVLARRFGFAPVMGDMWLRKLIEQGTKNRE